jgi:hypothetical protein
VDNGSERITGRDIFVKSYPINLLIKLHIPITSFSGRKNGSLLREALFNFTFTNACDPMKLAKSGFYIVIYYFFNK